MAIDAIAEPRDAPHPRQAAALADFLLRPGIAAEATAATGLTSAETVTPSDNFRALWPIGVYDARLLPVIEKEWERTRARNPESAKTSKNAKTSKPPERDAQKEDEAMTAGAPNFLIVMADQMAPAFLPIYGHRLVRAPNMQALAGSGVVFDSAYCSSPLCSPSRASFMAGRLPSRDARLRQRRRILRRHPDLRPLPQASRLSHHARRQDALLRAGPAAWLRRAADDRHLSRRLRLDAGLGPPRGTAELVSQHELGRRGRHLRAHQPARFRRRGRPSWPSGRSSTWRARTTGGPSCWSLRSPIRTTLSPSRSATGTSTATRTSSRPRRAVPLAELDPHSLRLRHVCAMDAEPVTDDQVLQRPPRLFRRDLLSSTTISAG